MISPEIQGMIRISPEIQDMISPEIQDIISPDRNTRYDHS